jgi:NitT/TauT family transport system substrate-binding protein
VTHDETTEQEASTTMTIRAPRALRALTAMAGLAGAAALAQPAAAADELTLQLKWVTQAQFAGYYVAKDKGFYEDAGLDVTIRAGGPDINPSQVIAAGGADVVVDWMPSALATREKGVPLVNIAQMFQRSGMQLTCRNDSGVTSTEDFPGHTLGVWFAGNEYPFLAWMAKLGYDTDGGEDGVRVLKQGFNVDPLLQKQAACISTMTYNEYWQVIDAGLTPDELTVFKYEDQGVATLEDGLYVLESTLDDEAMVDRLARFVDATVQGWNYAIANQDEAVGIVLENDATGAQTEHHQARMLGEIAKLFQGAEQGDGYLDPADFERTVDVLLSGDSAPVITGRPEGAWTHDVWDKAAAM